MAIQLKVQARTLREVDAEVPEGHYWYRFDEAPEEIVITAESAPVVVARVGEGAERASGALSLGAVRWQVTDDTGTTVGAVDPADPFRYRVPRPSGPMQIIVQCQEVPARAGARLASHKQEPAGAQKWASEPAPQPQPQPQQRRPRLRRARRLPPAVIVTVWLLRGTISKRTSGARHSSNAGGLSAARAMGWRDSIELGVQFEPVEGPMEGIPEGERGLSYGGHIELQGMIEPSAISLTGCRFHFVRWKYDSEGFFGADRDHAPDGDDTSDEATLEQHPTDEGLVFDTDAPGQSYPDSKLTAGARFGLKVRFRQLLAIGPRPSCPRGGGGAWQQIVEQRRQLTAPVEWSVDLAFRVHTPAYFDSSGRYHNATIDDQSERPSLR